MEIYMEYYDPVDSMYAIVKCVEPKFKKSFMLLTHLLVNIQKNNYKFVLFDLQESFKYEFVLNNWANIKSKKDYKSFLRIFKAGCLFDEIFKIIYETRLHDELPEGIKENLLNSDDNTEKYLLNIINIIIISNVIKHKLNMYNAKQNNSKYINLFIDLQNINENIASLFGLQQYHAMLCNANELNQCLTDVKNYNYHCIMVDELIKILKEEDYKKIFDLFDFL